MPVPPTLLGGLSPDEFLAEYWQKKPLLVRGALPGFKSPLSPDELAGLACEEDVTSRLLLERGGARPWELRYGPFDPSDFADLPATHWTLLVQEVDRLLPEVADFLDAFRFIPNWRIDDVQISYAPPEGNAGPHVDSYDVFLFQGMGRRRWQISCAPVPEAADAFAPNYDVRLLRDFHADEEWILEPGDLLYLPPRHPHYGVALNECMTWSVGFRAPTEAELISGFFAHASDSADLLARYSDPDLRALEQPGLISEEVLAEIRTIVRRAVANDRAIDHWFGRFVTEPKRGQVALPHDEPYTPDEVEEALKEGARLRRTAVADFAYVTYGEQAVLFVGGNEYPLGLGLAFAGPLLTGTAPLTAETLAPHLGVSGFFDLLLDLLNAGHLLVEG